MATMQLSVCLPLFCEAAGKQVIWPHLTWLSMTCTNDFATFGLQPESELERLQAQHAAHQNKVDSIRQEFANLRT